MSDKEWKAERAKRFKKLANMHTDKDLPAAWNRDGEVSFKTPKHYLISSNYSLLLRHALGMKMNVSKPRSKTDGTEITPEYLTTISSLSYNL